MPSTITDRHWDELAARELLTRTKVRSQKMRGPRTQRRGRIARAVGYTQRNRRS